jgi:hypothetical protein
MTIHIDIYTVYHIISFYHLIGSGIVLLKYKGIAFQTSPTRKAKQSRGEERKVWLQNNNYNNSNDFRCFFFFFYFGISYCCS